MPWIETFIFFTAVLTLAKASLLATASAARSRMFSPLGCSWANTGRALVRHPRTRPSTTAQRIDRFRFMIVISTRGFGNRGPLTTHYSTATPSQGFATERPVEAYDGGARPGLDSSPGFSA